MGIYIGCQSSLRVDRGRRIERPAPGRALMSTRLLRAGQHQPTGAWISDLQAVTWSCGLGWLTRTTVGCDQSRGGLVQRFGFFARACS